MLFQKIIKTGESSQFSVGGNNIYYQHVVGYNWTLLIIVPENMMTTMATTLGQETAIVAIIAMLLNYPCLKNSHESYF